MIKVSVNRQSAVCHKSATEYITTGQVGQEIVFEFSEAWDGFSKTAVFKGSGVKKDALLVSDRCEIPHECLTVPGDVLSVGVYGINGDKVTPTIYCIIDRIKAGADPSGEESEGATPKLWQQAIDAAGQANQKAQKLLDMAARGEFDGPPGEPGEPGPRGSKGDRGEPGEPGKTPIKGDDYWTDADKQEIVDEVLGEVPQPDWNQNNTSKPDYIKNRPFYAKSTWASSDVYTAENDGETINATVASGTLEAGKTYIVELNGTTYDCVAYHPFDVSNGIEDESYVVIGDISVARDAFLDFTGIGNGEPFAISQFYDIEGREKTILYVKSEGDYQLWVSGEVIKLNGAYLPDTAVQAKPQTFTEAQKAQVRKNIGAVSADEVLSEQAQADWDQGDSSKPDYIKNRPFYTTYGAVIAEEQTVTTADKYDEGSFANLSVLGVLEVGKAYHVLFNGTAYDCVAYHPMTEDGRFYDNIVIGSSFLLRGFIPEPLIECGNGEPFAIVQYDGSTKVYAAEDGTYTLKVTEVTDVVKIERKYLDTAQTDWNQNDESQPDFVKNRPMYMETPVVIVQEQTVITADDGESITADLPMNGELEVGKTYAVTFNGASYKCTAYHPIIFDSGTDETFGEDTDFIYLGESTHGDFANPGYIGHGKNEPFLIIKYPYGDYSLYTENEGVCTIKVTSGGVVIDPAYQEAIKALLSTVELVATMDDGTKQTLKLYGEAVTG